jgi:hypothetical protein
MGFETDFMNAFIARYIVSIVDKRPRQLQQTLPIRLVLQRGAVYITDQVNPRNQTPSSGIFITTVNGIPVPDAMAYFHNKNLIGFQIKDDITQSDFELNILQA